MRGEVVCVAAFVRNIPIRPPGACGDRPRLLTSPTVRRHASVLEGAVAADSSGFIVAAAHARLSKEER